MKIIETIYSLIFKKERIFILVILFIYVLFHKLFEDVFNNTVVKYFFDYVESTWYNDILMLLLIALFWISAFYRSNKYKFTVSNKVLLINILFGIFYLYYRFWGEVWSFKPFYFINSVNYFDSLLILLIIQWIHLNKTTLRPAENKGISFINDVAIDQNGIDELGYSKYANQLAEKIISSKFENSFAIGINGKWGTGKTSFINILKKSLGDDNIIEVDFNPWDSNSPKGIIQDFFEKVQESISLYHSTLSKLLNTYSSKLLAINDNNLTKSFQSIVNKVTDYETKSSLFNDINEALKNVDKKLIIYIDDLDRLDKEEIVEVIRLIRNTANFYNVFFVVAYDRNYVIKALENHNNYNQEQFLEKIFQIEISLPYFDRIILREKLAQILTEKLPVKHHHAINDAIIGSSNSGIPTYLNEWLENLRDVTRLANALILNMQSLLGEVVLSEFIRLELIRLKYPSVYELLYKNTEIFLDVTRDENTYTKYQFKELEKQEISEINNEYKNCKLSLELYLRMNFSDLSIKENEIDKIINLLGGIFASGQPYYSIKRSHISVTVPTMFNRYFAYSLLEGSLSEVEFSNARRLTQEQFNTKILEWVNKGLESELQYRFEKIKSFDNKEDFEKIITGIFYFARQKSKYENKENVGFDTRNLVEKLDNYDNKLTEKYYLGNDKISTLKDFIKKIFDEAESPFLFESVLIRHINYYLYNSIELDTNEFQDIAINYLKKYCDDVKQIDRVIFDLFYNTEKNIETSTAPSTVQITKEIPLKSKEIFKNFISQKDLKGYLTKIIEQPSFQKVIDKYRISNSIKYIFDDWNNFQEFLSIQTVAPFLAEFMKFYALCEETNFQNFIDFDFKEITVNNNKEIVIE